MNRTQVQAFAHESETPEQILARTSAREVQLSRLLIFFISGSLLFMLLPGTFLGVWNIVSISSRRAAQSISLAWILAHGHAQVLGCIDSFIFGIGFYSIPKLHGGLKPFGLWSAWLSGSMWMAGVLLRWLANVYLWQWRENWGSSVSPLTAYLRMRLRRAIFRSGSLNSPKSANGPPRPLLLRS